MKFVFELPLRCPFNEIKSAFVVHVIIVRQTRFGFVCPLMGF
jgi:hypothetical protein